MHAIPLTLLLPHHHPAALILLTVLYLYWKQSVARATLQQTVGGHCYSRHNSCVPEQGRGVVRVISLCSQDLQTSESTVQYVPSL